MCQVSNKQTHPYQIQLRRVKKVNPIERSSSTQFLIFTLFGYCILPRGGTVWTADLLYLLDLLGVNESTARSALSRMVQKGWLVSRKEGRSSQYSLTAKGRSLLKQGEKRIFEPPFSDWDGLWYTIVYSIPEDKRDLRHALRKQLIWLGFGRLAPGSWVSPHNRQAELCTIFDELQVQEFVELFSSKHLGPSTAQALIQRCWDLPGLEAEYQKFVAHYQANYEACLAQSEAQLKASLESCFVRRFWLIHDFQSFPPKDPHLPTELLPDDWIGFKAWQLFDHYGQRLDPYSTDFIDAIINGEITNSGLVKE
jgi:phenylacetic acid degradation operon negative regulatory protein